MGLFALRRLTSVLTGVTVVLVEGLQRGDVGRSFYDLIHPLDGPYHLVAFFLSEDRRTLVLWNLSCERAWGGNTVLINDIKFICIDSQLGLHIWAKRTNCKYVHCLALMIHYIRRIDHFRLFSLLERICAEHKCFVRSAEDGWLFSATILHPKWCLTRNKPLANRLLPAIWILQLW